MTQTNRALPLIVACLFAAWLASASFAADAKKPVAAPKVNNQSESRAIPPTGPELAPADRAELESAIEKIGREIEALRQSLKDKPAMLALLPDIQVYHNALRYPLQYHEQIDMKLARNAISSAQERIDELKNGKPEWITKSGPRGYVSDIDGSVQPYMLAVPAGLGSSGEAGRKYRLDVNFHGRGETLTELNFIGKSTGNAPGAGDKFVAPLYGRFCNANKFAGEIDCLEAIRDIERRYPIDENRLLDIGFSMGGAAAWQFAVHYTDLWAAASPGAGFAESKQFLHLEKSGELASVPWYQKVLWHMYDCTDYAANLFNLPVIAYAGEIDPQKQASDVMQEAMAAEGLKLERIIGPKTAHAYEKGAKAELDKRLDEILAKGRNPVPNKIRFTTWTLRYNRMYWLTVDRLGKHWERARADGEITSDGIALKTENVEGLTLAFAAGQAPFAPGTKPKVTINGAPIDVPPVGADKAWSAHVARSPAGWDVARESNGSGLAKQHGLQGPIDDAFMEPFVIVRPTGKAMNEKVGAWTTAECDHAIAQWQKQFRGEARVVRDDQVSDVDIAGSNLILFGDPSSNKMIAKVMEKLPIAWTSDAVKAGAKSFPAGGHVPAMIYPNPLNPKRYVVLNSGFTFREFDYLNNARQVPKLPDWAIIDIQEPTTPKAPGAVVDAGFFGEEWELKSDAQARQ